MQSNDYYNLIVSGEPGHWDLGEGKTSAGRLHYCSVDTVKERFSPMSDAVEMSLKQFPAIFACETNHASPTPAYVGRITKVEHRSDGYYLHFERDDRVEPIPHDRLLAMSDALDIRAPVRGFGDLGCSHWSVKHVDLYRVLERYGLMKPTRDGSTAVSSSFAAPAWPEASEPAHAPVVIASARPRVFIVHGHNLAAKYEVQALLGRLGLDGVILDEQAGRGDTIIEKFERESDSVAFAVVLLTPDDKGGVFAADPEQLKPRARQNVILELGYFAAKLGRGHVCALRQGAVEIPSDYSGVQYLDYDGAGAWKTALARELREADLPVDMNHL